MVSIWMSRSRSLFPLSPVETEQTNGSDAEQGDRGWFGNIAHGRGRHREVIDCVIPYGGVCTYFECANACETSVELLEGMTAFDRPPAIE